MEPQNVGENSTTVSSTSESSTMSDLLVELRDLSKKRLFFQKIATGCLAGILLVIFITCIIIVPKAITTLSRINNISVRAESSLDEIDIMAKGVTSATDSLNELVSGNSGSLTQAVTSLSQIDFEGLNKAITDLQDAAGPMAALMKRFR
ncbi:MAG: hypothetical protein J5504_08415 [Butyrivibrio sp.]|nr:hypothetical protein [Butyrivibrio sp.]